MNKDKSVKENTINTNVIDTNVIDELKQAAKMQTFKSNIKSLKDENSSLKLKIDTLRANNNSYLYTALIKFQAEMPIVNKNSTVYGHQKYASFAEIKRIATPILSKYGLYVGQELVNVDDKDAIKTFICHVSGQSRESTYIVPVFINEKTQIPRNEVAGSITFFMRRAFSAILGIVTAEDN